jgi:hypothetical protein
MFTVCPRGTAGARLRPARATPKPAARRGKSGKKIPEMLAVPGLAARAKGRAIKLMFQDGARFGRMARIRKCWPPAPLRPVVQNGCQREYTYVYGAVCPQDGLLERTITRKMNTEEMSAFLRQAGISQSGHHVLMIVDAASAHAAKDLAVPGNIELFRLPAYAPELNPREHIRDEVREKEFPNRVFDSMDGVIARLQTGLPRLRADAQRIKNITFRPWIKASLNNT